MQIIHASSGVEKGLSSPSGMPVEVMGLMHGHMDTEERTTLIVTDVSNARRVASTHGGALPRFRRGHG